MKKADSQGIPKLQGIDNPGGQVLPRLLSIKAAGLFMGMTTWSIRSMCWRGEVAFIQAGRKIYLEPEELIRWISKNRHKNQD